MAETKEEYVVDKNMLRFGSTKPTEMYYGGNPVNQAWYDGVLKYNRALYHIEVPDFVLLVTPDGMNLSEYFEGETGYSYKTDVDGTKSDVAYAINPVKIAPNEEEKVVLGTFSFEQAISGLVVSGTYQQDADYISHYEYTGVKIVSVMYSQIPAGGGWAYPTVGYGGTRTPVWVSGKAGISEQWGGSVTSFSEIKGGILENWATFDPLTGKVYADSLGKNTTTDLTNVASVTYVKIYVDGPGVLEWSGTAYAQQMINGRELVDTKYFISAGVSPDVSDKLGAEGDNLVVSLDYAYRRKYYEWESGSEGHEDANISLSVVVSGGVSYTGSVSASSPTLEIPVGANTGSGERTVTVNIYNTTASYDKVYTFTQEARSFIQWVFGSATVYAAYDEAEAGGGEISPNVSVSIKYYAEYTDGIDYSVSKTEWGSGVTVSSASGSPENNSGATINTSTGAVTVNSLEDNETEGRDVFTVKSLSGTYYDNLSGKTRNWSVSDEITVSQMENYPTYGDWKYSASSSISSNTAANVGEALTLSISAWKTRSVTWDSGYPADDEKAKLTATVTASSFCGLSASSVSGDATVSVNVAENTSKNNRTASVKVVCSDASYSKTHSITQDAALFEFKEYTLAEGLEKEGGTVNHTVISKMNGHACAVESVTSDLSGVIITAPVVGDADKGEYNFSATIPANNTTSARVITLTAIQKYSGNKCEWEHDQAGVSSTATKKAWFAGTFAFGVSLSGGNNYNIINVTDAKLSAVGDAYKGGTLSNLYFKVVDMENGSEYGTSPVFESVTVDNNSTKAISLLMLSNSSGSAGVEVEMWYDGVKQETYGIEEMPEGQE